jgi:hypothetical protein
LREKYQKVKLLVLEKGMFPRGEGTRMLVLHAGGISGDDLKSHSEEEVFNWLQNGWKACGCCRPAEWLLRHSGGYEVFLKEDENYYRSV